MAAVTSGNVSVSGATVTVSQPPSVVGSSWLRGAGAPDGTVGSDGDFYVDTNSFTGFYGPKTQGYWGSVRPFVSGSGAVNLQAKTDPSVSNDSSQGYGVASLWMNTATSTAFICTNATPGGAIWVPVVKVGSGPGTIAAGNDPRITGAIQANNNLADLASPGTALGNLGGKPLYFVRNVNASVTANFFDVVKADATSGALTVTLPPTAPPSMQIIVKKVDSSTNSVTVAVPAGSKATVDGASSVVLNSQGALFKAVSDGSVWTQI